MDINLNINPGYPEPKHKAWGELYLANLYTPICVEAAGVLIQHLILSWYKLIPPPQM